MRVGSVSNRTERSRAAGFTMIELLVVVGIIGVLAAILFPVIVKAKESAKIAKCISNMRQLGSCLTFYLDDNSSRFPAAAAWGAPSYWAEAKHGSQKTIQELLSPYVHSGMRVGKDGLYESPGVFGCPSDRGLSCKRTIFGVPPNQSIWKYAGCSYEYYAANQVDWNERTSKDKVASASPVSWTALAPELIRPGHTERVGAPLAYVVNSTRKAVLGDTWSWHMGDQVPDGRLAYRNTLFADGHAARCNGTDHEDARLQALRPWHRLMEIEEY
jgi:prepilin-type N-terminal cleavage/methylation domain-containing protein/prepilin-type processing-associated H-X9-DG protein